MRKIFILVALLVSGQLFAQSTFTSGGKLKPEQAIMDIRHYTIALNLDFDKKSIDGYTTIDLNLTHPSNILLFDLYNFYKISKLTVNNKVVPFEYKNNLITINLNKQLPAGKVTVKAWYAGVTPLAKRPPWDDGFIWTADSTGHPWMGITAEGPGGKLYFPCKDHPSDEPNEGVDLVITVPKNLVVAGPGLLQSVTKKNNLATFHWKTNYTINNYSILFAVGDYVVVAKEYTTIDGHKVPMQFYVLNEHKAKAAHHLDILDKTVHEQEKYFGEYPWAKEKIGIVETMYLGMEHQTMNGYGNKFAYTKVGGYDFDELMHHEFGHEWWGNKVTAADWADYWIHEGINTFGDALFIKEFEGEAAYIKHFKTLAPTFENRKPVVQGKDLDEETAYIGDIYDKGAFFMHTLRYVIGDAIFFPAIKKFVTSSRYTYDNRVVTDDVERFFSEESGKDLKPLFDLFIRTTDKLNIYVRQLPNDKYGVQLQNMSIPLPIDITTDSGTKRVTVDSKGIVIESKTPPVIDPDMYYLKKVITE